MKILVDTRSAASEKIETSRTPDTLDLRSLEEQGKQSNRKLSGAKPSMARDGPEGKPPGSPVAYAAYYGWQISTKLFLGVLYLQVLSHGLSLLAPAFSQKLYKVPGLGFLYDYDATYTLELSTFFALFMLIAVWFLWDRILRLWLEIDGVHETFDWNRDRHTQLLATLGISILLADLVIFYAGIVEMMWGSSIVSFTAFSITCSYVAILIFVNYVGIVLSKRLEESRTAR